ncbi:MAG TPA: tetratricopeptide repeat protein [Chloroflexota bacterium]
MFARLCLPVAVAILLVLLQGAAVVAAQAPGNEAAPRDRVEFVRLWATSEAPPASGGPIRFETIVDYELATAERAFLLLFVFEDDSAEATQDSTSARWIEAGSGRITVTTTYTPRENVRWLTLVVGLFKDEENLLAWSASPMFSLRPDPGQALFNQALSARRVGNYAAAVEALTAAIQLAPDNGYYFCWRGDSLLRLQQYDRALADYTRALDLMPDNHACRIGRGSAYLWKKDWNKAIADFTTAIERGDLPAHWLAQALRGRGTAFANLGDATAAIQDYQAYLRFASDAGDQRKVSGWIDVLRTWESPQAESPRAGVPTMP